jgi:transcriptional regulator with XRE-family HTH domain
MSVGKRIKERRNELHMSVDELAVKLNKNRATVYRYEKGDIENLPIDILEPLAKALETTPQYLMGWENKPNDDSVTVGELLKIMRVNRNMTIEEYSKEVGISSDDMRKYETGEKLIPLSVINTISEYYRLSMESFTKGTRDSRDRNNVRLERFKMWAENFGEIELTDEEHDKIIEYTKFLLYSREKQKKGPTS